MTRISASFLLAALATSVLRTDAAPLRLNTDVEARAVQDFLQDAACSNITTGLSSGLSSALAVLGQIKTSDATVSKDLATLKGFLTTASGVGNAVVGACNATAAVATAKNPTSAAAATAAQASAKAALSKAAASAAAAQKSQAAAASKVLSAAASQASKIVASAKAEASKVAAASKSAASQAAAAQKAAASKVRLLLAPHYTDLISF
ncbi:hypothetical protein DFH08DRAFT_123505 [Mycena albidolilacea]|uniref:Cell wall protein n=1 Tax=Mycena albidolilacea TaxID=1033008 RepID=A0AAD7A5X7_9AGAR|nr:hypothetical protein DFH08DRAFT_123505 [Mycena albidolilacea]